MQTSRGKTRRMTAQRRVIVVTMVAAAVLVPVAIAWACNPQARVGLDQPTYLPNAPMQVSGSFFKGDVNITVTVEPGGSPVTVRTSGNGFFATRVTAPSSAGSYTISAIGFEGDGTVTAGLPARASFQVSQASSPTQPGTTPGRQQPGATRPGATQPGARQFDEPRVPNAGRFTTPGRSRARARDGRPGASDRTAAVNAGSGVINSSGGGVFAGSVARADRPAVVASARKPGAARKSRATAKGAAPSERSAVSDVWSGLASANAPALMPRASDGAPSGGGTGLQLAYGLGLMAFALLALAGGLAAAERRRRQARAG